MLNRENTLRNVMDNGSMKVTTVVYKTWYLKMLHRLTLVFAQKIRIFLQLTKLTVSTEITQSTA